MNKQFIREVFKNEHDYFVIEQKAYQNPHSIHTAKNSIILIRIPDELYKIIRKHDGNADTLTLKELEQIEGIVIDSNVYLNEPFTPFQLGLRISDVHNHYGVNNVDRDTVVIALQASDDLDLWDYLSN